MGLQFTVETFDGPRRRTLGEFRRFKPACSAARRALDSPRTTLAVVRDVDGGMVFAVDGSKEWESRGGTRMTPAEREHAARRGLHEMGVDDPTPMVLSKAQALVWAVHEIQLGIGPIPDDQEKLDVILAEYERFLVAEMEGGGAI